jgi:hypothetical protein
MLAAVVMFALAVPTAHAATPQQKCFAGRYKAQGKYQACVQTALFAYANGAGIDQKRFAKCRIKYAALWAKLQTLIGTTCNAPRFADNGDGTISDNLTGLRWEQKTTVSGSGANLADPHDVDNVYTWSADGDYDSDGTTFTSFLPGLAAPTCHGGKCDWRIPTLAELLTILLPEPYPCTSNPCVDPVFVPVSLDGMFITETSYYWSATTVTAGEIFGCSPDECAWDLHFEGGDVNLATKNTFADAVRAVSGGL